MHKLSAIGMSSQNTIYEVIQAMDSETSMTFYLTNSSAKPLNASLPMTTASTVTITKSTSNRATVFQLGMYSSKVYYGRMYGDTSVIEWEELTKSSDLQNKN